MVYRKPAPVYIPSPNSPVPPMSLPQANFGGASGVSDYPPPLPDGWEAIMQAAMDADLDIVQIKRRLTRPPGISPAPSVVPPQRVVSTVGSDISLPPSTWHTRPPSHSRKRHEQYRPPTPPLPGTRQVHSIGIYTHGVSRSATTYSDSLSIDTNLAQDPLHHRGSSFISSNPASHVVPPIDARFDTGRTPRMVHEVQLNGLSEQKSRFSKSDGKLSSLRPDPNPDQCDSSRFRQRIDILGTACKLRLRRLGAALATLSVKR